MHLSIVDLWNSMGPLARAVVGVLAAMSIASLATATERWLALRRAGRSSAAFLAAWRDLLGARGLRAAMAEAAAWPESHLAALVSAAGEVLALPLEAERRREAYDRVVRRTVLATGAEMKRGLGLLATVGSTAPFVGLFGTVVGIVNAFVQLAGSGQGGVGGVSSGIAEALVTTALGIGAALPAVWLYNHLTQRAGRAIVDMQCLAEELAVAALTEQGDAPARTPLPLRRGERA